jgi:hypothetical protein
MWWANSKKAWENAEGEHKEEDTREGTDLAERDAASKKIAADLAASNADKR